MVIRSISAWERIHITDIRRMDSSIRTRTCLEGSFCKGGLFLFMGLVVAFVFAFYKCSTLKYSILNNILLNDHYYSVTRDGRPQHSVREGPPVLYELLAQFLGWIPGISSFLAFYFSFF